MHLKSLSRKCLRALPWRSLIVASLLLATTPVAQSDPLIITRAMTATTIAEFFVERDSVLVELEIGLADLPAFRNMLPPELLERVEGSASPLAERLTRFFRDDLTISTSGGAPLRGRLLSLSGNPLPNQDETAEMVLVATASYPLSGRPDTLVFSPPGTGARATGPIANIGFVVYHEGIPVNDFRYLAPDMTLGLDWDDPWYSRFTLRALRRQFYAPTWSRTRYGRK